MSHSGVKELHFYFIFVFEKQKPVSELTWTKVYFFHLFQVRVNPPRTTLHCLLSWSWSHVTFTNRKDQLVEVRCDDEVRCKVGPASTMVLVGSVVLDTASLLVMRKCKFREVRNSWKVAGLGEERTEIKFRSIRLPLPRPLFLCFRGLAYPVPKQANHPEFLAWKTSFSASVCAHWLGSSALSCFQHSSFIISPVQTESTSFRREAIFILITPFLLISSNIYKNN